MAVWRPTANTALTNLEDVFGLLASSIDQEFTDVVDSREIKTFKWANNTERLAAVGTKGDIGVQLDDNTEWRHDGTAFRLAFARVYGRVKRSATAFNIPSATYANVSANSYWTADVAQNITAYNGGWTAPVAGQYQVDLEVRTGVDLLAGITVNSTAATPSLRLMTTTRAVQSVASALASGTLTLAKGDIIRPYLLASSSSSPWIVNEGSFGLRWVAP